MTNLEAVWKDVAKDYGGKINDFIHRVNMEHGNRQKHSYKNNTAQFSYNLIIHQGSTLGGMHPVLPPINYPSFMRCLQRK